MKCAELLVKCLENEDVSFAFGLPGEENLELLGALSQSEKIKTIIARDERNAAFMANAFGRLTGRPGVCFSTLGPGATNLVTGIADALLDFAPAVAITAQASSARRHKESHQYVDLLSMFRPITKWNCRVEAPATTNEIVRKAFRLAAQEKQGPVHIELSEEIAEMPVDSGPIAVSKHEHSVPNEAAFNKASAMISDAHLPVILAGHGVIRGNASGELVSFARKTGIAVINTFMGMGAVPADDELFVSTIGLQARDYIQCGLDRADLIIAVGYDPVEFSPQWWDGNKKVIHINATPAETDQNYTAFELLGDLGPVLKILADVVTAQKDSGYFLKLKKEIALDMADSAFLSQGRGISPLQIIKDIRKALGRDDILISDVGAHKIWIGRFYPAYAPNTVIISNGFASMGFALPAAIAARLQNPGKKIIAAVGDGGFMMSVAELETAVRYKLPFVAVIFNDNGYGLIKWKQQARCDKNFFVDLGNPDFVRLAESFGCKAYRAEHPAELFPAIDDALQQAVPSVIDCRVDYSTNMKLTEKLGQIVCKI
ncbi:MAG: acetolactate synthase large subunit [Nitrospirae bacterium]|nr:MAG: acetolactate synthase large subunit [Nitrospirota bacterium]